MLVAVDIPSEIVAWVVQYVADANASNWREWEALSNQLGNAGLRPKCVSRRSVYAKILALGVKALANGG